MTNKVTVPFTCLLDISRKRQQLQARKDTNAIPDNILFVRLDPLRFWQNWLRYLCRGNPKTIPPLANHAAYFILVHFAVSSSNVS